MLSDRAMNIAQRQMINKPLSVVRENLQAYADRGVFRGFSEFKNGHFQFIWVVNHRMELSVDTAKHELRFKRLLHNVPAKSPLYAELKSFIERRHDEELPIGGLTGNEPRSPARIAEASFPSRSESKKISTRMGSTALSTWRTNYSCTCASGAPNI
jgi:hypothetical protein